MKGILKLSGAVTLSCLAVGSAARAVAFSPDQWITPYKREALQDIVTWDKDSIFVNGERIFLYSGEVHPYRSAATNLSKVIFADIVQASSARSLPRSFPED